MNIEITTENIVKEEQEMITSIETQKIITSIEAQKKNKTRVNVYLNNEYDFSCSTELIYYHNLKKDMVISMDKFKVIIEEDNYISGKNYALKCIERTYKTEKELTDKLIEKEYKEDIIQRVMKFMKEYNFLDDEKYTQMYINEKINSAGKTKIKYALLKKGISEELILDKLSATSEEEEEAVALKLLNKKYASIARDETDIRKIQKKLGDFLYRNGFKGSLITSMLKRELLSRDEDAKLQEIKAKEEETEEEALVRNNQLFEEAERRIEELKDLAEKRYNIIIKSEKNNRKAYKKLSDYLIRRGYSYDEIKVVLKELTSSD